MRVVFPNPYGYKLPQRPEVDALQHKYGFSDQYAQFLLSQNGLSFDAIDAQSSAHGKYLVDDERTSDHRPDLRYLYGLNSGKDYADLAQQNEQYAIFSGHLMVIGSGYGGDEYVEVLKGRFRGCIGSLDHDMYASCDSVEQFAEEMGIAGFTDLSADEQADRLLAPELGLIWFHAGSFAEFAADGVHCDDSRSGYVINTAGAPGSKT